MIPRFFCPLPLAPGATLELPEAVAHHALNVLKLGAGETVILFDGHGGEWQAVLQLAGKRPLARLTAFSEPLRESALHVTLAQALPAADKMDWIVQKAVELGVARIQPVTARRSVVKLSGPRVERRQTHWQGVAVAACEQSGRTQVPEVLPLLDLPHYLAQTGAEANLRLIAAPVATLHLRQLVPPSTRVDLLIGPEGGFESDELHAARAAGFQTIQLGPRVLRTETAGLAALAAMQTLWGDF
ncbi:MAG: 16S rRNA (uracil(1498)-N(3))-methyltransferase [Betaproteobacteria bacterium HGW-Betaproteobacteria-11]|nr:MAG: 16S rRNA (uracil(1498)-N(3))-methyltransferase [Betaproteobacteria bacterium HGW-Betaproteobacteria-11]